MDVVNPGQLKKLLIYRFAVVKFSVDEDEYRPILVSEFEIDPWLLLLSVKRYETTKGHSNQDRAELIHILPHAKANQSRINK